MRLFLALRLVALKSSVDDAHQHHHVVDEFKTIELKLNILFYKILSKAVL